MLIVRHFTFKPKYAIIVSVRYWHYILNNDNEK